MSLSYPSDHMPLLNEAAFPIPSPLAAEGRVRGKSVSAGGTELRSFAEQISAIQRVSVLRDPKTFNTGAEKIHEDLGPVCLEIPGYKVRELVDELLILDGEIGREPVHRASNRAFD
jgi:hypothetical protein